MVGNIKYNTGLRKLNQRHQTPLQEKKENVPTNTRVVLNVHDLTYRGYLITLMKITNFKKLLSQVSRC